MSVTDSLRLAEWFRARDYRPVHATPLAEAAARLAYWTESDKHADLTDRDIEFLRRYIAISLAAGVPFHARGINLGRDGFVRPDKAVMNSCLNAQLVELNAATGVFELTLRGHSQLGLPAE